MDPDRRSLGPALPTPRRIEDMGRPDVTHQDQESQLAPQVDVGAPRPDIETKKEAEKRKCTDSCRGRSRPLDHGHAAWPPHPAAQAQSVVAPYRATPCPPCATAAPMAQPTISLWMPPGWAPTLACGTGSRGRLAMWWWLARADQTKDPRGVDGDGFYSIPLSNKHTKTEKRTQTTLGTTNSVQQRSVQAAVVLANPRQS